MKLIPLTRGRFAQIDDDNFDLINQHKWQSHCRHGTWYATAHIKQTDGVWRCTNMHRFIMGLDFGDKLVIDHINHDGLDNQKSNLRICTVKQNLANRKSKTYSKSQYLGVYWSEPSKKWRVATRGGNMVKQRVSDHSNANN